MAKLDKDVEDVVANLPGIHQSVYRYAFEIHAYAEAILLQAREYSISIGRRVEFDAFTEIEKAPGKGFKNGWDVVLNDELGDSAAYNIEKGRKIQYFDEVTGLPRGEMHGLYVLEGAVQATADRHRSELR